MLRLPPANLADRRDDLRRDQIAAANVVPRHLSHDPDQTGNLQHRTRPASRCEAYDRLGSAERLRRIERQIFRSAHSKAAIPLTAKIGRLGRSSEGPLWVESRHSN